MDGSSGYEAIASEFLRHRSSGIGVQEVRNWARTLPCGSTVLDLGCGPGFPITSVLVDEKLDVFAVEAAPSLVDVFKQNLPDTPILCEAVQTSSLFHRSFDAVLAWGLMFLLEAEDQYRLIQRIAEILVPNGRLLFTSPADAVVWRDAMTGMRSVSLGAEKYRSLLSAAGISVKSEYQDEGQNYYFDAYRR
jgi:SAM-dependent methyltransferase